MRWLVISGLVIALGAAALGAVAWWHAAKVIALDEENGHVGGLDEGDW